MNYCLMGLLVRKLTLNYLMGNLVCRCSSVYLKDVAEHIDVLPHLTEEQIKETLNVGMTCGSCNHKDSNIVDKNFSEVFQYLKER